MQRELESAAEVLFDLADKQRDEAFDDLQEAEAAHRGGDWARTAAKGGALP